MYWNHKLCYLNIIILKIFNRFYFCFEGALVESMNDQTLKLMQAIELRNSAPNADSVPEVSTTKAKRRLEFFNTLWDKYDQDHNYREFIRDVAVKQKNYGNNSNNNTSSWNFFLFPSNNYWDINRFIFTVICSKNQLSFREFILMWLFLIFDTWSRISAIIVNIFII